MEHPAPWPFQSQGESSLLQPWVWPQHLRTLGTGDASGTSTSSSLQKNSENTHSYISRVNVSLCISHLPSKAGLNLGGSGGWRGWCAFLLPLGHNLPRSLAPLPACPQLEVFGGLPNRYPNVFQGVRWVSPSPHTYAPPGWLFM